MARTIAFTILLHLSAAGLFARQSEKIMKSDQTSYRVRAGVDVGNVIPKEEHYLFSQFQKCSISYADGKTAMAMANYNLLYQRMQLITVRGDTVTVKLDYRIKQYDFGSTTFLNDYKHGLVEVQPGQMYPLLGKRAYFLAIEIDEGYHDGYTNQVSPSASYSVMNSNSSLQRELYQSLSYQSNVIVKKQEAYFIIDRNERVHPAKGNSLYEIMPRYKHEIKSFVTSEDIDFNSEMALSRLMIFCQNLASVNYVNRDR